MTRGPILTINCGSTSVRVACFDAERQWRAHLSGVGRAQAQLTLTHAVEHQMIDVTGVADHRQALDAVFRIMPALTPIAVGHRIVHGGVDFVTPTQSSRRWKRDCGISPLWRRCT